MAMAYKKDIYPFQKKQQFAASDGSVMVAAIDFGTTFSGYGFSFQGSPNEIICNKNWGDELGASSYKAPTSVLVNGKEEFVAFGYKAEHQYSEMCITEESDDYDLYRQFKMMLYNEKNINRTTKIKSTRGNICRAQKIFAMALKFMKDHLLQEVSKHVENPPSVNMIKWVITIPAIWSDKAKQFMREAAFEAGLITQKSSKQLLFALEPEAAAVLCRNLEVHQFREHTCGAEVQLKTGTKYMIVDAGGGTIDIAAHEVLLNGNIAEIACGSGGDWGGKEVDKNFILFLTKILGDKFMHSFQTENPSDWLEVMTDFECKKKATNLTTNTGIRMQLSWSMAEKYLKLTGLDITKTIQKHSDLGISFKSGNIILSQEVVLEFFTPVIENIIKHVQGQIDQNPELQYLDYILLVGGFSESNILYERMKTQFSPKASVISPHSAGLAIIKGAVMFGHNPKTIVQRLARKTYGQSICEPFNCDKHKVEKRFWHEEEECYYCGDLFQVLIKRGEKINADGIKIFYLNPFSKTATTACTKILISDKSDAMYTDDEGVEKIGHLSIDIPLSSDDRTVETKVYFGLTEIQVEFRDITRADGDSSKCGIDFLTDTVEYKTCSGSDKDSPFTNSKTKFGKY